MTPANALVVSSDLLIAERDILKRVAEGGPLHAVMRDIVLLVERPSDGEMLASILMVSDDGKSLLHGAAPSLPAAYNEAIHGIPAQIGTGSCGTAAFTGNPVIVTDIALDFLWADYRDLALGHGLGACWSMPIKAADGRVLGTFANYYREPKAPTERDLEVISMVARTTAIAIERHLNDLAKARAEEQRSLLLRELNHRVKNVFALVQSLVTMSARSATSVADYATALQGRMNALSRAHELVQPGLSVEDLAAPPSVAVRQIFQDILAPYHRDDVERRITLIGGDEHIRPDAITGIALVLHELATNGAKYGSLSTADGVLAVSWHQEETLEIRWVERGGPSPMATSRPGFGSTLIKRTIEGQFSGAIHHVWHPDGLEVIISLPVGKVLA